jgi:hypothetical protein
MIIEQRYYSAQSMLETIRADLKLGGKLESEDSMMDIVYVIKNNDTIIKRYLINISFWHQTLNMES